MYTVSVRHGLSSVYTVSVRHGLSSVHTVSVRHGLSPSFSSSSAFQFGIQTVCLRFTILGEFCA